jgi:hypothetical protein
MRDVLARWRTPALRQLGRVFLALVCSLGVRDAEAQLSAVLVGSGFDEPVAIVPDPSLPAAYVVERAGLIRVILDGVVQPEPFLDLRREVDTQVEGGLLGMAIAPGSSGRVFVHFTNRDRASVIARFSRSVTSPLQLDATSRFDLRWPDGARAIRQPFGGHNGGHLAFGPDGLLYVGLGDGGGSNDPLNLAQNTATLFGKMLRLDVNVDGRHPSGYVVPADNPFAADPSRGLAEIWAIGLRNPWRYSFDDLGPGATNGLFIADVGQQAREEINFSPALAGGRNYGWRVREGRIPTPLVPEGDPTPNLTEPILDYDHTQGNAVIGGFVYRGTTLPARYHGRYFFADYSTGRIWSLTWSPDAATGEAVVSAVNEHTDELGGRRPNLVSFARDRAGELYVITQAGEIWKIVANRATPSAPLDFQATVSGTTVTLRWKPPTDGPAPLAYRLQAGFASDSADIAVLTLGPEQLSVTIHNVPPSTYYVRISTVGTESVSGPSEALEIVVRGPPSQRP